jgi:hypothetical protein
MLAAPQQPKTFTVDTATKYNILDRFPDDRNRLLRIGKGNWAGRLSWKTMTQGKSGLPQGGNPPEPFYAGLNADVWTRLRNRAQTNQHWQRMRAQAPKRQRPPAYQTSRWREPWQPPSADRRANPRRSGERNAPPGPGLP